MTPVIVWDRDIPKLHDSTEEAAFNTAFSILPIDKAAYEQYAASTLGTVQTKEIPQNKYNKINLTILSEAELVEKYFKNYIKNAIYYPEEAYKSLDAEYRDKRFGSFDEYKKYIELNYSKLISMDVNSIKKYENFNNEEEYSQYIFNLELKGLDKYLINNYNNYTQYTCIDDYGNYYIFKAAATMRYTLILDTYTLDLPEFLAKYNSRKWTCKSFFKYAENYRCC